MLRRFFSSSTGDEGNSFLLYAGFQQREGQRIETERTFVNFVQIAHRGKEKRKKRKEVYICYFCKLCRKDRKIGKPNVQGECHRN